MNDEVFKANSERVGLEGMSRRLFLRATLAGGASLLTGRAATLFAAASANDNSSFSIGGDLPVNRLGFGAMRLTGEGIWGWPPDRENALKVLRRAVELGANLIDTADAYGPETDELLIAEALYPYPKGLVIATKGGNTRPGPDQWVPDGRPEYLKQCVDKSLKRLKIERIDLYQLHRVDPKVPMEDSLGALKEMQSAGKIRHIGLSEVSPEQVERARKIVPIVTVQNRYNITDRKMGQYPRILRKRTDRLYAMGAGWWHQRNDKRRLGKSSEGSPHNHLSAGAGVAAASIPSNAADSRHVIARTPGGKYGGADDTAYRRRMEGNWRGSEPNVIGQQRESTSSLPRAAMFAYGMRRSAAPCSSGTPNTGN